MRGRIAQLFAHSLAIAKTTIPAKIKTGAETPLMNNHVSRHHSSLSKRNAAHPKKISPKITLNIVSVVLAILPLCCRF